MHKSATAPVDHFVNPEKLVGLVVTFNPEECDSLFFRAYVQSIEDGKAMLSVSVPFAVHGMDLAKGHIYSLTLFAPKLPPIPPTTAPLHAQARLARLCTQIARLLQSPMTCLTAAHMQT